MHQCITITETSMITPNLNPTLLTSLKTTPIIMWYTHPPVTNPHPLPPLPITLHSLLSLTLLIPNHPTKSTNHQRIPLPPSLNLTTTIPSLPPRISRIPRFPAFRIPVPSKSTNSCCSIWGSRNRA